MKKDFKLSLKLEEGPIANTIFPLNQTINGKLTITPQQRLHVDSIAYQLIALASEENDSIFKVKAISSEKILARDYLAAKCLLSEFEPYHYKISFRNDEIETYTGTNITIRIILKIIIKLNKKDSSPKGMSFLGKLKEENRLPYNGILFKNLPIKFGMKAYDYQLMTTVTHLELKSNLNWLIVSSIGFFSFFAAIIAKMLLVALIIIGFSVTLGLLYYYTENEKLSKFTMECEQVDNKVFLLKILNDNWQSIKCMSVRYEIREETHYNTEHNDKRTASLHCSEIHTIENPRTTIVIKNEFPEAIVGTTNLYPTRLYWVAVGTIQTIKGVELPYRQEFIVKKKTKQLDN